MPGADDEGHRGVKAREDAPSRASLSFGTYAPTLRTKTRRTWQKEAKAPHDQAHERLEASSPGPTLKGFTTKEE